MNSNSYKGVFSPCPDCGSRNFGHERDCKKRGYKEGCVVLDARRDCETCDGIGCVCFRMRDWQSIEYGCHDGCPTCGLNTCRTPMEADGTSEPVGDSPVAGLAVFSGSNPR